MLLKSKPSSPPLPTFAEIKLGIGQGGSLALALLAVATFANSQPSPKALRRALKEAGYSGADVALSDLKLIEPFFVGAISDLAQFKTKLERNLNRG